MTLVRSRLVDLADVVVDVLCARMGGVETLGDGCFLLRGGDLGCARLLVLLRDAARDLPAGTVIHLETTDPVAPIDLPAWCRMTGHEYLGPVPDEGIPRYGVRVPEQVRATDPASPWRLARDPAAP